MLGIEPSQFQNGSSFHAFLFSTEKFDYQRIKAEINRQYNPKQKS